ncbi:MAG: hypothetical protein OEY79_00185 [Anaplasmataceae bacterium]|nr:hypothetical protein [Anaplasmataceae bacterium]
METNRATQENIQEQYVPKQQYSSHSYYTEEDRLRDKLKESEEKNRKLEAQTRDDRIFNAINELKTEIASVKTELELKIEKVEIKIETGVLRTRNWVIGGTLTTLIGIIIAVFTAFAKHWVGV